MVKRGAFVFVLCLLLVSFVYSAAVDDRIYKDIDEKGYSKVIIRIKDDSIGLSRGALNAVSEEEGRAMGLQARKSMIRSQQAKVLKGLNLGKIGETGGLGILDAADFDLSYVYSVVNGFSGSITEEGLAKLMDNPDVEGIYYDKKVYAFLDASVPLIRGNDTWGISINRTNITGRGETVCVIDTGVDYNHPSLGGGWGNKVVGGYDFVNDDTDPMDDHSHGTHVAGIVVSDNETYRGIAPDAKIVAIKVLNSAGSGDSSDANAGIDWCTDNSLLYNISVITMSLGDCSNNNSYCNNDISAPFIDAAVEQGIAVTVAAGNCIYSACPNPKPSCTAGPASPACVESAIAVGSVDDNNNIYYQRGALSELLAPGVDIMSSKYLTNGFYNKSGTSMSAPHAAGAAALLQQFVKLQNGTALTPQQIRTVLNSTGTVIDDSGGSGYSFSRIDVYAALLSLDNVAPAISFVDPTPGNASYRSNSTTINITSNEVLKNAWIIFNNTNISMNGSSTNWHINISGDSSYNYTVYGNDSAGNTGYTETRLIYFGNIAPQILNLTVVSSDSLNRTNGTLAAAFSAYDVNNDALTNETAWYNNSVLVANFSNTTSVHYNYTLKNQNWTFSIRAFDGQGYSSWSNFTITINNAVPEIVSIADITVNESEQLNITVNATDIDPDSFNYSIDNGNFTLIGITFVWNTTVNDSGSYIFNITVNDSQDISSIIVYAAIFDMVDSDGDGIPDYTDADDDNDGMDDTIDFLLGNSTGINSINVDVSVAINGSTNLSMVFNSTLTVNISSGNNTLVEFNWAFNSSNILNLYNLTIIKQLPNSSNASLLIKGLNLIAQNKTKTVYLDRILNGTGLCINDEEIDSIGDISDACTGTNEAWIACPGTSGNYNCSLFSNNTLYKISGLSHSGIIEQATYCGDSICNGAESCSSCSSDCGSCPAAVSTSSGGGGGGGGGLTPVNDENTISNTFISMKAGTKYILQGKREGLAVTKLSFYVERNLLKGHVTINKTELPKNIPAVKNAYQYFQVTLSIQLTKEDIGSAEIEFKVDNAWLRKNDIGKVNVLRFDSRWEKYPARLLSKDNEYSYYSANLPGFSYFAVAGEKNAEEKELKAGETSANKTHEERNETEADEVIIKEKDNGHFVKYAVFGVAFIIAVIVVLIIIRPRIKDENLMNHLVEDDVTKDQRHTKK